jgi:hypothetical protein
MALIDIGAAATDRDTSFGGGDYTLINKDNPANATGIITSVEIWANTAIVGCEVATFYSTGTDQFSTRATATIGAVAAGSKQTFTGLSLACQIGDYIGIHFTSGRIEASSVGGAGYWYAVGDNIPCTTTKFTFANAVWVASLYATGADTSDYPKTLTVGVKASGSAARSLTFLKSLFANVKASASITKNKVFVYYKTLIANVSVSNMFTKLLMLIRGTFIKITPPGGTQQTIRAFETCQTTLSTTDRAGSFSLSLPAFDNSLVDAFPVGSDVRIEQDNNVFRGWVVKPPKSLDGEVRTVSLEGSTYTSRTQKTIVTESYTNMAIGDIVLDLFAKYVPWATVNNVQPCSQIIKISFDDAFLWDAMGQLCTISAYDWFIDENLDVNFFDKTAQINSIVLSEANFNYKQGTANFTPDASRLVNKLWVKGGKAISAPYTQSITVGTIPIPLFYTPLSPVTVTIGGTVKTLGIQNIHSVGTHDFLLNEAEKLLVPDLCTSGSGTIVYCYNYPIKILLEDKISQAKYGEFDDILTAGTDDKILVREMGIQYLYRYSDPVMTGSIQPLEGGVYKPGELIKIEIPDLNIDDYFQIQQVQNESVIDDQVVNCTLQLETRTRDVASILKDMNARLAKLETANENNSGTQTTVEKYSIFIDTVTAPTITDSGFAWSKHQYHICSLTLICSPTLII